jgi:hypothetical protein
MEKLMFLDLAVFDDDFYKMALYFLIHIVFLTGIIRGLYYPKTRQKEYVFVYYLVGIIVFLICFTLKKFELDIGMALGLFAIFGIIRYRTTTIPIKEMTYLFVIIGVSVINALMNPKTSLAEVVLSNAVVIGTIYIIEYVIPLKSEHSSKVVYEKIEHLHRDKQANLIAELEERTGHAIHRIKIGAVDFSRKKAHITMYYYGP